MLRYRFEVSNNIITVFYGEELIAKALSLKNLLQEDMPICRALVANIIEQYKNETND